MPHDRLAITSVLHFLPGLMPYESTIVAEFFPSGETVRMVVTLDPMHDEEFTKMLMEGFSSQLSKLDKRYGGAGQWAQIYYNLAKKTRFNRSQSVKTLVFEAKSRVG